MSGFGSRPTAAPIPVEANRQRLAEALLGIPSRIGNAFTGMAQQGLQANAQFMQGRGAQGEDLYAQPLMPSLESGGRLGALSGFLTSNMALGGPAGTLGAGPSMAKATAQNADRLGWEGADKLADALMGLGYEVKKRNSASFSPNHGQSASSYLDVMKDGNIVGRARISDHSYNAGPNMGDYRLSDSLAESLADMKFRLGIGPDPHPAPVRQPRAVNSAADLRPDELQSAHTQARLATMGNAQNPDGTTMKIAKWRKASPENEAAYQDALTQAIKSYHVD